MSSFSTLLRCVYRFHFDPALGVLFPRSCALSTFSTLLHEDYFHVLIQEFSSGGGGGEGVPGQSDKKALTTFFFSSPQVIVQKSNG